MPQAASSGYPRPEAITETCHRVSRLGDSSKCVESREPVVLNAALIALSIAWTLADVNRKPAYRTVTAEDFALAEKELFKRGYVKKGEQANYAVYGQINSDCPYQACLLFDGKNVKGRQRLYTETDPRLVGQAIFVKRMRSVRAGLGTHVEPSATMPCDIQSVYELTGRPMPRMRPNSALQAAL